MERAKQRAAQLSQQVVASEGALLSEDAASHRSLLPLRSPQPPHLEALDSRLERSRTRKLLCTLLLRQATQRALHLQRCPAISMSCQAGQRPTISLEATVQLRWMLRSWAYTDPPYNRQRRCRNFCSSPMDVPEDGPWPPGRDRKGSCCWQDDNYQVLSAMPSACCD